MNTETIAVTEKKGFHMNWMHTLHLTVSLLIITAAAALILSLANAITADRITALAEEKQLTSMAAVMPGANVFSELYCEDTMIDSITGAYNGTKFLGYCVQVSPNGFGGSISLMVGISEGGAVTGVSILDHSETGGVGSKADSPDYLEQYIGKSGTVLINTGKNSVDGITGATITSKAITNGVNTALNAVLNYDAEGGHLVHDD